VIIGVRIVEGFMQEGRSRRYDRGPVDACWTRSARVVRKGGWGQGGTSATVRGNQWTRDHVANDVFDGAHLLLLGEASRAGTNRGSVMEITDQTVTRALRKGSPFHLIETFPLDEIVERSILVASAVDDPLNRVDLVIILLLIRARIHQIGLIGAQDRCSGAGVCMSRWVIRVPVRRVLTDSRQRRAITSAVTGVGFAKQGRGLTIGVPKAVGRWGITRWTPLSPPSFVPRDPGRRVWSCDTRNGGLKGALNHLVHDVVGVPGVHTLEEEATGVRIATDDQAFPRWVPCDLEGDSVVVNSP
jgi:hypothetical protein